MKRVVSVIVPSEGVNWEAVDHKAPPVNTPVLVRLVDETQVRAETESEICYCEDVKIALVDEDGVWKIEPPFPKYDFSPLSDHADLDKNVRVSHWVLPTEEELKSWHDRFKFTNFYRDLTLHIDEEYEEDLYRALMVAGFAMSATKDSLINMGYTKQDIQRWYTLLCDLQTAIDIGGGIEDALANSNG